LYWGGIALANSYDPVNIALDEQPAAILRAMDSLKVRGEEFEKRIAGHRKIPRLFFFAGLALIVMDFLFGYKGVMFQVAGGSLWLIALVLRVILPAKKPVANFAPGFKVTRSILHTLRDDLYPGRGLFGRLDLSGYEQKSKVAQKGTDALGREIVCYRDEWLSLRAKLYDGNMLRLSAIERVKIRKGYWKKGSSGKSKWRGAQEKGREHQLKVRLAVNPETYAIENRQMVDRVGNCAISAVDTSDGIITVLAGSGQTPPGSADVLGVLKFTYGLLQRRS
jgi:hypothetical protein